MSSPNAYTIARDIGNNFHQGITRAKDENAIESILSSAISSGNPQVLQDSIGKILSQVSPERQGVAVQYLQQAYQNVQNKQKVDAERTAAQQAGYTYGVPAQVAAQQVKDTGKNARLAQFGLGGGGVPRGTTVDGVGGVPQSNQTPQEQVNPISGSPFKNLNQDQLIEATGHPDREVSEPAKAELKRRDKERETKSKFNNDLSKKTLENTNALAEALPQKENALSLMKDAIARKDLSFFSPDNIAELTGLEGLRTPEGALFKTAGKEFFLGNLGRAGARPNQWIEQQISDMLPKIGRSTAANLSVERALENEIDLDKEKIRLTEEIANEAEQRMGYIPRDIASQVQKRLSKYAQDKQKELFNDLRAIKAIDDGSSQVFNHVEQGTQVSRVVAQALLRQSNNDPKKAAEKAKKLGYAVE